MIGPAPRAFYSLVHRFGGPVASFTTEAEAQRELEAVLQDRPGWADEIWIEPPAEFRNVAIASGPSGMTSS